MRARGPWRRRYPRRPRAAARRDAAYSPFVPLLLDLAPLRENAPYRRLYAGFTLSNVGSQLAVVAIGLQVYDLTRSTAAVGIVGLCALVPLVVMGLYGGTLVDHFDRRVVGLVAQSVAFVTSILCALQAWLGQHRRCGCSTCWSRSGTVRSPSRRRRAARSTRASCVATSCPRPTRCRCSR